MPLRITIFSQVRLFSESLANCLGASVDVDAVTICDQPDKLADDVIVFSPDIVLIDVTCEQALAEARTVSDACPGMPILALALPENPNEVIACADAGIVGYVTRQASLEELQRIMDMALKGECPCHPRVTGSLLRELKRRGGSRRSEPEEPLTHRECEVLRLLGRGYCNKEIARELVLSVPTVKNHLHNIFVKLRVKSRTDAMARLRNEPWLARSA